MAHPRLVILDEPTSALDPLGRRDVRAIIQDLRRQGVTVFLNSHLLSEVELVCDRVAFVNHGRVVREGRVQDLVADRTDLLIRVGDLNDQLLKDLRIRWQVQSVEADGMTRSRLEGDGGRGHVEAALRITVEHPSDAGEVARLVVGHGACLLELVPQRSSLEELFLELVEGASPNDPRGPVLKEVEGGADGRLDVRPAELARSRSE
jgi:ABC-2 type transport system ATP-binding protein